MINKHRIHECGIGNFPYPSRFQTSLSLFFLVGREKWPESTDQCPSDGLRFSLWSWRESMGTSGGTVVVAWKCLYWDVHIPITDPWEWYMYLHCYIWLVFAMWWFLCAPNKRKRKIISPMGLAYTYIDGWLLNGKLVGGGELSHWLTT